MSKYHRLICEDSNGQSDVYDILHAYEITNPALQHAIKKTLMPGERGDKSFADDIREAILSLFRALEIEGYMQPVEVEMWRFAGKMAERLRDSGKTGWDDETNFPSEGLVDAAMNNLMEGRYSSLPDAANFMMMLWYRGDGDMLARYVQNMVFDAATYRGMTKEASGDSATSDNYEGEVKNVFRDTSK